MVVVASSCMCAPVDVSTFLQPLPAIIGLFRSLRSGQVDHEETSLFHFHPKVVLLVDRNRVFHRDAQEGVTSWWRLVHRGGFHGSGLVAFLKKLHYLWNQRVVMESWRTASFSSYLVCRCCAHFRQTGNLNIPSSGVFSELQESGRGVEEVANLFVVEFHVWHSDLKLETWQTLSRLKFPRHSIVAVSN